MEAIGGVCQGLKITGDFFLYMNNEMNVRSHTSPRNVVVYSKLTIDFPSDDERNVSRKGYL